MSDFLDKSRADVVNPAATNVAAWIELVSACSIPFSFCEDERFLKHSKLHAMSRKTLKRYMRLLGNKVMEKISELLPTKVGIVFDGWTDGASTHYVAFFATFISRVDESPQLRLLSISPMSDETKLTSENYKAQV